MKSSLKVAQIRYSLIYFAQLTFILKGNYFTSLYQALCLVVYIYDVF